MRERPYTTETLAERWQCSAQHIRDMVRTGHLEAFRVGRLIRISAAEVERIKGGGGASEGSRESGS